MKMGVLRIVKQYCLDVFLIIFSHERWNKTGVSSLPLSEIFFQGQSKIQIKCLRDFLLEERTTHSEEGLQQFINHFGMLVLSSDFY